MIKIRDMFRKNLLGRGRCFTSEFRVVLIFFNRRLHTGGNETALARPEWRHKEDTVRYSVNTTDGGFDDGELSRGRRNGVTSKTEACPRVVGEGPARYTYLRSGDINKC